MIKISKELFYCLNILVQTNTITKTGLQFLENWCNEISTTLIKERDKKFIMMQYFLMTKLTLLSNLKNLSEIHQNDFHKNKSQISQKHYF